MPDAYERAAEQLAEIADASDGTVQLHRAVPPNGGHSYFHISIRFDGIRRADNGLRVRAREPFVVAIPATFPYRHPIVWTTHRRFAGFAHVQWRRQLCLYGSSADWHPEDGMYGFITRLDAWMRDAAINNLDPDDAPLHPPVAYPCVDRLVVPLRGRTRRCRLPVGWICRAPRTTPPHGDNRLAPARRYLTKRIGPGRPPS